MPSVSLKILNFLVSNFTIKHSKNYLTMLYKFFLLCTLHHTVLFISL